MDISVGAPGHGKFIVDGMNSRYKQMLKLSMEKLSNPKISQYYQMLIKFMQVHEDEEDH